MDWSTVAVFLSVIAIDVTLALDNALVMGIVIAKLPVEIRHRALFLGVCSAVIFRILLASVVVKMLTIIGLTLAGGFLLLWVVWKVWRELRQEALEIHSSSSHEPRVLRKAVLQILLADLSMSLDNTLAVAGVARNHFWILVFGLLTSVVLIGVASKLLSSVIQKHKWISYVGLIIVGYVAITMIWDGAHEVLAAQSSG